MYVTDMNTCIRERKVSWDEHISKIDDTMLRKEARDNIPGTKRQTGRQRQ